MSFLRLIYYSAMVGGWAGLLGWLVGEAVLMHHGAQVQVSDIVVTTALCGAFIASGLALLAVKAKGSLLRGLPRVLGGFIGGLAAGALGSVVGNLIYSVLNFPVLPRALGFMVMGLAIGGVDGLLTLNWPRLRNGLIGGTLGGFLGGLLFDPVLWTVHSPMSSRAIALTMLGLFIGLLIGFTQVLLRQAWLTVEQGFRPGRQLVLTDRRTTLGTSERASLIFIAYGAKGVEPQHCSIEKQPDGSFWIRDNGSRSGTLVNEQPVAAACPLQDGDAIRIGTNVVRFKEHFRAGPVRAADAAQAAVLPVAVAQVATPSPVVKPVEPRPAAQRESIPARTPAPPPTSATPRPAGPVSKPARPQPKPGKVCPVCGTKAARTTGKVACENCGAVF